MRLDSLTIRRFRNYAPGTVEFGPGMNIVLGKNATGKTTLLNLVAAALSTNFSEFAAEPFDVSFVLRTDHLRLEATVRAVEAPEHRRRRSAELMQEAPEILEPSVEYRATFGTGQSVLFRADRHTLSINDKVFDIALANLTGPLDFRFLLFELLTGNFGLKTESQALRSLVTPSPGDRAVQRFDESQDLFRDLTNTAYFKVRHFGPKAGFCSPFPFAPNYLRQAITAAAMNNPDVTPTLTADSSQLPFLAKSLPLLGFAKASLSSDRRERKAPDALGTVVSNYGHLRFSFTRADGSSIDHSLLSYGQKRLLAFHYWLDSFQDVVVADELVNGMHHEWIADCIQRIEGRQAFLTSQNPLLLDYLHFESAADVQRSFVTCSRKKGPDGRDVLSWANFTPADAEEFFSAYQVGIQHVSEILTDKGLW